ncbi:hypothetical protein G3I76_58070 [Streptomyces sp. SID11233]|uniref:hypothetical protein n=1 Tax=Streptomyces sp. SID11385 TaxID=2706031 RepID=UPI0013BFD4F9|nr:hypothetical protein [Streptomyces sp. SID11385]NEA42767.1 hypothetical protein [Streptomyces sp. SID11385]NED89771.1 hypothetical protein [Streptomyces sp. SID11233]
MPGDPQRAVVLHSRPAHRALGWCGRCPGRDLGDEVRAWRDREVSRMLAVSTSVPEEAARAGS